jgi:hypothetical protein
LKPAREKITPSLNFLMYLIIEGLF